MKTIKISYEFLPEKKKTDSGLAWWKFQNALLLRQWKAHTLATFVVIVSLATIEKSKTITIEEKLISSIIGADRRTVEKAIQELEKMRLITCIDRQTEEKEEKEEIDELEDFDPEVFEQKRKEWQEEGKKRRKGAITL